MAPVAVAWWAGGVRGKPGPPAPAPARGFGRASSRKHPLSHAGGTLRVTGTDALLQLSFSTRAAHLHVVNTSRNGTTDVQWPSSTRRGAESAGLAARSRSPGAFGVSGKLPCRRLRVQGPAGRFGPVGPQGSELRAPRLRRGPKGREPGHLPRCACDPRPGASASLSSGLWLHPAPWSRPPLWRVILFACYVASLQTSWEAICLSFLPESAR